MPPIEAVLVDVGGVLVLPDHDRMAGAFERAGVHVDRDRLDRAHYAGVAALTEFTDADLTYPIENVEPPSSRRAMPARTRQTSAIAGNS